MARVVRPASKSFDIVTIADTNAANRPRSGPPRYAIGDYAVVLDEAA
jgi:hypothetical protein